MPLLISLNLLFFLHAPLEGTAYGTLVLAVVFTLIMITGTVAISGRRRVFLISILLVLPALCARWLHTFGSASEGSVWIIVGHVSLILFMIFLASEVLFSVLSERFVTGDTLIGSVCVYLLIGFTFAVINSLIEYSWPHSFRIISAHGIDSTAMMMNAEHFSYMVYYSFVTLTTMGFGDITPLHPVARVFATAEAVAGQIYLAAFVARLVGLHIVWHSANRRHQLEPSDSQS